MYKLSEGVLAPAHDAHLNLMQMQISETRPLAGIEFAN